MNIDVGQVIAGKYELVKLLGKGAMGEVWLANHDSLGGEFAIKLVEPADDVEAETAAGRFQLEAQIAAKLSRRTRHIVSVSDHGEENGLAYLVMELLEGESLESKAKRAGPLDLPEVIAIVSQVARALSLAHEEGIFHRDLKPANVWLGRDEDGRLLVKLLDFGIARSAKPFRTRSPFATSKDMVLGTPSYMSPEQARGLEALDYRCDLWALAVVAFEALTGRIPFTGETVEDIFLSICTFRVISARTLRPDLPPAIEAFFARAFAVKIEDRFSSAAELTAWFEGLVTPEALDAALGLGAPLPASARRLEVARGGPLSFGGEANLASRPSMGSQPSLSRPNMGSQPELAPMSASIAGRGSVPDFEDAARSAPALVPRRDRGPAAWLIALAGLIVLLGLGLLLTFVLRDDSDRSVAAQPVERATSTTSDAPPTTAAPPATSLAAPEPTTSTNLTLSPLASSSTPSTSSTTLRSAAQPGPKPSNGSKVEAEPVPPPAQPTTPTASPPHVETPQPVKSSNKAEVF